MFAPLYTGLVSVETFGIGRHGERLAMTLIGHYKSVSCPYSPDGHHIASASVNGTVRIWDVRTGQEAMAPLRNGEDDDGDEDEDGDDGGDGGATYSVSFSPNGKSVASGAKAGVYIWTGLAGQPTVMHLNGVSPVAFSPNGSILVSGSSGWTIRLWSAETGENVAAFSGHTSRVLTIAFCPNSQILASCSHDRTIRLWNCHTSQPLGLLSHGEWTISVCFSPDGSWLASGSGSGNIQIWDWQTGSIIKTLLGHSCWVYSVHFSPDGRLLVSASSDKSVRLWTLH